MLYSPEEYQEAVVRMYEYLQMNLKYAPRTLKWEKPAHRKAVENFVDSLPMSAGYDFIWNFLCFQFYIFAGQIHEQKPNPAWFLGKEAWERYKTYDEGIKYYVNRWVITGNLKNPVQDKVYRPVSEDALRKERLRYSRISGANYCNLKWGDDCYDPNDVEMCGKCPFAADCEVLFGEVDATGRTVLDRVSEAAERNADAEFVKVMERRYFDEYGLS